MIRRLSVALVLLFAVLPAEAASPASSTLSDILAQHDAAFGSGGQFFSQPTVVQQIDNDPLTGERVSFHWQQGRYREEYRWLGFTEVFAFDGHEHWYGSDVDLP